MISLRRSHCAVIAANAIRQGNPFYLKPSKSAVLTMDGMYQALLDGLITRQRPSRPKLILQGHLLQGLGCTVQFYCCVLPYSTGTY